MRRTTAYGHGFAPALSAILILLTLSSVHAQPPGLPGLPGGGSSTPAPRSTSRGGSFLPSLNNLFKATTSAGNSGSGVSARLRNRGQKVQGKSLKEKLRMKGDLTLSGTSLRDALLTISESWKINIVVGDEVEGTVNGSFRNAPLHEILHAILYANGFGYRAVGESLSVTELKNLGNVNPLFKSVTIRLQAAKIEDVATGARHLISPQGKIETLKSTRSLFVADLPERVARVQKFAAELDLVAAQVLAQNVASGVDLPKAAQFRLQFVKVSTVTAAVQSLLSKGGRATSIAKENRLVVIDSPARLENVTKLIKQLDVPRPQVRITALIYDASLEDIERIGINWNHALKDRIDGNGQAQSSWSLASNVLAPAVAGDIGGVMTFMNLSRHFDITATVQLLNQSNNSRLLADPNVLVEDQEVATIQIVTEIPFQQLTQTAAGGDIGTTSFREAGVTLNVTPHIANDGTIKMLVTPTFSRLVGFTQSANPQPIIDKREASTTVRVANGQTLVIGGLRQRTDINNYAGTPFFKDIKFLNIGKMLFQSTNKTMRESELLVFLRPEIVGPLYGGKFREQKAVQQGVELLNRMPLYPRIAPPGPQPGCPDGTQPGSPTDGYLHHSAPIDASSKEVTIPKIEIEPATPSKSVRTTSTQPTPARVRQTNTSSQTRFDNGLRNYSRPRQNQLRRPTSDNKKVVVRRGVYGPRQPVAKAPAKRRVRRVSHAGMHAAHRPRTTRQRSNRRSSSSQPKQKSWLESMFD